MRMFWIASHRAASFVWFVLVFLPSFVYPLDLKHLSHLGTYAIYLGSHLSIDVPAQRGVCDILIRWPDTQLASVCEYSCFLADSSFWRRIMWLCIWPRPNYRLLCLSTPTKHVNYSGSYFCLGRESCVSGPINNTCHLNTTAETPYLYDVTWLPYNCEVKQLAIPWSRR